MTIFFTKKNIKLFSHKLFKTHAVLVDISAFVLLIVFPVSSTMDTIFLAHNH